MPKIPKFKMPTNNAQAADMLYKLREKRLQQQAVVNAYAEAEGLVREYLIENLAADSATGISGKIATANIERKEIVKVDDWDKLQAFIKKFGRFDLVQRRISDVAARDLMAQEPKKAAAAGLSSMQVKVVSCTKR